MAASSADAYVLAPANNPSSDWLNVDDVGEWGWAIDQAANFGAGGTVATDITVAPLSATIDTADLSGVDGLVLINSTASTAAYDAALTFLLGGGDVLAVIESTARDFLVDLAISADTGGLSNGATRSYALGSAFQAGPFGSATSITQTGSALHDFSAADILAAGGLVAAQNAGDGDGRNVAIALFEAGVLGPNAGRLVLLGDSTLHQSAAFDATTGAALDADGRLSLNLMTFMIGAEVFGLNQTEVPAPLAGLLLATALGPLLMRRRVN